jgi:PKD repeat protein
MTVNEGATANQPLTATDPDGNALTFSKVSGPTYMTVTTTSPGTGTATGNINLAPGFSDAGTATAAVAAGHGGPCPGSDTKSFTITVNNVNRPPVLTQPANLTVNEGSTAEILVTGSDPDNDPLTFMLDGCGGFSVFDPITRRIRITPGFNDAGVYTCTVTVSDGQASDSKTITITVLNVNRAPTLNPVANMTTMEGGGCRDDQVIAGSDPDADALTFFKTAGPTFMTVTTTSPTTGNIHLAAGFSDAGVFSATVSASDGSLSDSKSFTITVSSVNRAPVLAQPANMTVTEGATANQTITASDPDGCPITFSKVSGPSFMTVTTSSPTTGNIALAPGFSDAGTYGATVTASDGTVSDSKSFSITVNNSVPPLTLTQPSNMTVNEGGTADQSLIATDPAGLPVTFSKVSGPIFMTVTTTDPGAGTSAGNVHLAPGSADAGTYTAVVRATDTSGASDQKAFTITVINVNHEPVSDPNGPYSGIVGVPVNFNGSASSDPDGDPLTYEWDFDASDGITVDATGPTSSHTYTTTEVFTVTLTVEDNGSPNLSDTATTTATITTELPANVFLQTTGILKLKSNKPRYCFQIEPVNGSYNNTDVILSSVVLKYGDLEAPAEIGRTSIDADVNGNGVHEIRACFTTASLRTVFAGLPAGDNTATVALEGDLTTGGRFRGTTEIVVRGPVSGSASATSSVSPNPLNPHSTLFFTTSEPGLVSVAMYDLQGRLVRTILSPTFMPAGTHEAVIDGRGAGGEKLPSGVYFIRGVSAEGEFKQVITILK